MPNKKNSTKLERTLGVLLLTNEKNKIKNKTHDKQTLKNYSFVFFFHMIEK